MSPASTYAKSFIKLPLDKEDAGSLKLTNKLIDFPLIFTFQLAIVAEERELNTESFTRTAQPFIERLHEVWLWQNQHGTGYRKAHRSSIIVRRHEFYR